MMKRASYTSASICERGLAVRMSATQLLRRTTHLLQSWYRMTTSSKVSGKMTREKEWSGQQQPGPFIPAAEAEAEAEGE